MQFHLFLSCFIMVLLTMSVLVTLFRTRMRDMRSGITDPKYFKTYDLATKIPKKTKQMERNYTNLLETPMMFYAVIGLVLALGLAHLHLVILAYLYVLIRVTHTVVHITGNKLYPRMITFWSSVGVLLLLWVRALLLLA